MGNKNTSSHKKPKREKVKQTVRLLSLGISGSGKTTFAKQMKIISGGGFTEEEKEIQKRIIYHNIKLGIQELIKYAQRLENPLEPENLKHSRYIAKLDTIEGDWSEKISNKAKLLWNDPGIQRTWKTDVRYQLQICHLDYFIDQIERISSPSYCPTNEDMLRSRQRTTGEQLTTFVNDRTRWELVDAGGQKPERTKWEAIINSKELISAIIYFTSLDEYDVISPEDPSKTKMQISLESWHEVIKSEQVRTKHITLILFLNKMDVLTNKLQTAEQREQFEERFPDWNRKGIDNAAEMIKRKFLENTPPPPQQEITSHCLCALDTSLMEIIFKAVKNTIFDSRIMNNLIKL